MNCPYCEQEMEKGFVQANTSELFWSKNKSKVFFIPSEDDEPLTQNLFVTGIEAHRCYSCKKILINL